MIQMFRAHKHYRSLTGRHTVLSDAYLTLPDDLNVGIIGANGSGKSTLLRLLSGIESLDSGIIKRSGRISFPVGLTATFHSVLTGHENARFLARLYGVDEDKMTRYVEDFSELGVYFRMPIETYSAGMRARLAFGVSLAIQFDTYLVDEVVSVGDVYFQAKCKAALVDRMKNANVIMVSHDVSILRAYCRSAAVLRAGRFEFFDDVEDAIVFHQQTQNLRA